MKLSDLLNEFPELNENTITITLNDDNINEVQAQEQEIIIPSETWKDIYQSTLPDQPWWDQIIINVDNLSVDFELLESELIQNGYYLYEENENGDMVPKLIENYNEGDEYDIRVNVPQQQLNLQEKTVNVTNETTTEIVTPDNEFNGLSKVTINNEVVIPTINLQEKTINVTNETISEDVTPDEGFNGLSRVTVNNDVIVPTLETLTNKRIQKESISVSDLMSNPTNDEGITKQSTLIVDIPDPVYPTITFDEITNNGTYTLDQLTINQSENFSRDSVLKIDVDVENLISPDDITQTGNWLKRVETQNKIWNHSGTNWYTIIICNGVKEQGYINSIDKGSVDGIYVFMGRYKNLYFNFNFKGKFVQYYLSGDGTSDAFNTIKIGNNITCFIYFNATNEYSFDSRVDTFYPNYKLI